MYYAETIIDGVLHYKLRPDAGWREMSKESLTQKLEKARNDIKADRLLIDTLKGALTKSTSFLDWTTGEFTAEDWDKLYSALKESKQALRDAGVQL